MIEIVNAYTRSGNEWCTCCQKQTNTKRIKFSYDGRQGNSVVLCDDCRRELARTVQAIPLDKIKKTMGQIIDEKDFAYADFDEYKMEVLGVEDADDLPNDDFRYGMERCLDILNRLIAESEE